MKQIFRELFRFISVAKWRFRYIVMLLLLLVALAYGVIAGTSWNDVLIIIILASASTIFIVYILLNQTYHMRSPPKTLEDFGERELPSQRPILPPPRYTNVEIFKEDVFNGEQERISGPLVEGRRYVMDVSVSPKKDGILTLNQRPARPFNQESDVELLVVISCAADGDWTLEDSVQRLKLQTTGASVDAARFHIQPSRGIGAGRRDILIKIYYKLNLIDALKFSPFIIESPESTVMPSDGVDALVLWNEDFPSLHEAIALDIRPNRINIALSKVQSDTWGFTVVLGLHKAELPLVADASFSDEKMRELSARVRGAWDDLITDPRLHDPAKRNELYAEAIQSLAAAGRYAWNELFTSGGISQSLRIIGRLLKEHAPPPKTAIQIVCLEKGIDFPFPWSLLCPEPPPEKRAGPPIMNFWGLRYELEVTNARIRRRQEPKAPCTISYAAWRSEAANRQKKMLSKIAGDNPGAFRVLEPTIESKTAFMERLEADACDILYVLSHGYTRLPSHGAFTAMRTWLEAAERRTKSDPSIAEDIAILRDNLELLQTSNKYDWIKLTKGTITHIDLGSFDGHLARRPIVFLNMCQSAQVNSGVSSGFVGSFLQSGASAVIGTECPVPTFFAEEFAESVFEFLAYGLSIGEAVYEARRLLCDVNNNPLGLAYTMYGSSRARFTSGH